jgi:hypothetical protein
LHTQEGDEDWAVRQEKRRLKDGNFHENLLRQTKKLEFKKQQIIEKESAYTLKVHQQRVERQMLEKCKAEA